MFRLLRFLSFGLITLTLLGCATRNESDIPPDIQDLIQYEDRMALAGDVSNIQAVTATTDAAWWAGYQRQVQSLRPVAPPIPNAVYAAGSVNAVAFAQRDDTATVTVSREYRQPSLSSVAHFSMTQRYAKTDAGWQRLPPPLNLGFPAITEQDGVRIVHYPQDAALLQLILPGLTADINSTCEAWAATLSQTACLYPLNVFLTTNPDVLLTPAGQQRVAPLPAELVTNLGVADETPFLYVPSVALVGAPLDEAAEAWWQAGLANQVLTAQLKRLSILPSQRQSLFAAVAPDLGLTSPAVSLEQSSAGNTAQLAILPTLTPRPTPIPTPVMYTVQSGDTLGGIASVFGISTAELLSWNQEVEGEIISVGTQLRVPAIGMPTATPFPTITPVPPWTPIPPGTITVHTVADGETLLGIALRYSSTIEAIMDENGLASENFLAVGVEIRVPMNILETEADN